MEKRDSKQSCRNHIIFYKSSKIKMKNNSSLHVHIFPQKAKLQAVKQFIYNLNFQQQKKRTKNLRHKLNIKKDFKFI